MNNIYFRKWLDLYEAAAPYFGGVDYTWINPDTIWKVKNSMTFFYTENKLFVASDYGLRSDITHTDFTLECPELYDITGKNEQEGNIEKEPYDGKIFMRYLIVGLAGRYVKAKMRDLTYTRDVPYEVRVNLSSNLPEKHDPDDVIQIVSFWNGQSPFEREKIKECIGKLISSGHLESGVPIYIPNLYGIEKFGSVAIKEIKPLTDEDKEKMDLQMRLHLMNPVEKKAAMEKLGLGGVKVSKRWDWEAGMRGLGMPGYMRQSEVYRGQ
jgi:hypothetical protein